MSDHAGAPAPPILREFPDRFESDRPLLRTPLPGDGADVHAAIEESRGELTPWMPWAHVAQSVEMVEANVREARADFLARRVLRLHLYLRDGGAFVGSSGLRATASAPMARSRTHSAS